MVSFARRVLSLNQLILNFFDRLERNVANVLSRTEVCINGVMVEEISRYHRCLLMQPSALETCSLSSIDVQP